MGIVDEDVAAVRAGSDIVAIVSKHVHLRRVGNRWQGLCPFHPENTPSFSVNPHENVYHCFGCQVGGDVITFVREIEQLGFPEAVEYLAGKAGITLRYTDHNEGEGRKRRAKLVETMAAAVEWYHQRLVSGRDAGPARRYLRERGLDGETVREFQIGWAPEGWDELCRALRLDKATAEDTGLGRFSRGRLNDHFRARIMFPIYDESGKPISFGGRILPGGEGPGNKGKYKNTTETSLYNKSRVLYGLDRSRRSIVTQGTAVICEGYTDVIGFHRSGVPLAVATCGTALTDEHVRLLGRFAARKLVLAFDTDAAGQAAAERFYRWEREHELEVVVADLPEGEDPADTAQRDPARLLAAIDGATPFLAFRLDRSFDGADLTGPEGRARAAERALAIVGEHPSDLVRDQYLMQVASRCRFDPERLRPQLERLRRSARSSGSSREARGTRRSRSDRPAQTRSADGGRTVGGQTPAAAAHDRSGPPAGQVAARGASSDAASADDPLGWIQHGIVPNEPPPPDGESSGPAPHGRPGGPNGEAAAGGSPGERPGQVGAPDDGAPMRPVREGPALEVLRHAVHDPGAVARWLDVALFDEPVCAGVYQALVDADTHADALAQAPPHVGQLLTRLLVEEPSSEPFDAMRLLLREVAMREMRLLRVSGAAAADPDKVLTDQVFLARVVDDLRAAAAIEAADRLLAWLEQRVGDRG